MEVAQRLAAIRERLEVVFEPEALEIDDQSHLHAGHAGARDGRGHFRVMLVTGKFDGMGLLARHRAIYDALGDLMQTDIHALTIEAVASDEL